VISEAVWPEKAFFRNPLKNEFEQTMSAMAVKQMGFGDFFRGSHKGTEFQQFLGNLDGYRRSLGEYRFDPDAAARKLLELIAATPGRD